MTHSRSFDLSVAIVLLLGTVIEIGPLYLALTTASHSAEFLARNRVALTIGGELATNIANAWHNAELGRKLLNSVIVCLIVTLLRLVLSVLTAFALVYFRSRFRTVGFGLIFLTLMLPLEVRIVPTYGLMADLLSPVRPIAALFGSQIPVHIALLDSYIGLSLPLAAAAAGTFLFWQFFQSIPGALLDAAKVDGVNPMRFLIQILIPLSYRNLVALAVVTFVATWNQYLWPLLITTRTDMETAVLAIKSLTPDPQNPEPMWNLTLAGVLIIGFIPVVLTAVFQRQFTAGVATVKERL